MTTWRDLGDRVVSIERLSVSDLADSPASDSTTLRERRPMGSAVADAGDMPELSPPMMMVTGAWLRSTFVTSWKTTLCALCGSRLVTVISVVGPLWLAHRHGTPGRHLWGGQCGGV
jgi:hypothetical protein